MTQPLRMSFDVHCPAGHAFAVWTSGIGTWWPADHTVTGESGLAVVMESGVGGRIYERSRDGAEHDWGEVTVWDPPERLVYLWHLRRDRSDATEVEIRFLATDPRLTRIEIEHRGWERLGRAAGQWREANQAGWASLLPHFQRAVTAADGTR
ncbi:MAG TPA: SRPBCC domain-containing protein [Trebonia sp.]